MKVLLVGGGAREHAMGDALAREEGTRLHVFSKIRNPGLAALAHDYAVGPETDARAVVEAARAWDVEYAAIGPEAPLAAGVSDALRQAGVRVAAPSQAAAEVESSKYFMRQLLRNHNIPGNLGFYYFTDPAKAKAHLARRNLRWAIKPIGLTGGKGVRVFGDHFRSLDEGAAYIDEVIRAGAGGHGVLLEELVDGEEFTLQAFCDGSTVLPTVAVQDHKRLEEGDRGPNTGGMGSYSQADGLLPFLPRAAYDAAFHILKRIVAALKEEGRPYVGPIYGQFMLTGDGPRVIEVNARLGDPEAINVLGLLDGPYGPLVRAMADARLHEAAAAFRPLATVVKYVVPQGYGAGHPRAGLTVEVDEAAIHATGAAVYYANVESAGSNRVTTHTSRALALLGRGETIRDANRACEAALLHVRGDGLHVRHDIGTDALIERRLRHMSLLARGP